MVTPGPTQLLAVVVEVWPPPSTLPMNLFSLTKLPSLLCCGAALRCSVS